MIAVVNKIPPESDLADDDLMFLLDTLQQYISPLREQLEKSYRYRLQLLSIICAWALLVPAAIYFAYSNAKVTEFTFLGRVGLMLFSTVSLALAIQILLMYFNGVRRSLSETMRLSAIVQTLLRRASQLHDRGNFPFSQRVLIEVRLADAEALIEQAAVRARSVI